MDEANPPVNRQPEPGHSAPTSNWRRGIALPRSGLLWAWPLLGVALIAIAGQLAGRIGAMLVAGMGLTTFVLIGSELLFHGRKRLYAVGIAFAIAAGLVLVALAQPIARSNQTSGSPTSSPLSSSANRPLPATDLRGQAITPEILASVSLAGADLRGTSLQGLDLRGRDMDGAMLAGSSLVNARLDGASLRGADLSGADLRGACLQRADLRGANLLGADATGADVRDTQLSPGTVDVAAHWPGGQAVPQPTICA